MTPVFRAAPGLALLLAVAGCSREAPAPVEDAPIVVTAPAPAGPDWSRCHFPGLALPVPGKLFVVDGGLPGEDAEPGRETIRRVEVQVPGEIALLLTAPDASAWAVRVSPDTRVTAIFASGDQPQRITGQGLGPSRLERSVAMGDDCGRYWFGSAPGASLDEAVQAVFGRRHDAVYTLVAGQVIIGGSEFQPEPGL
ncbi:MAG TPA: hypothetical protein VFQ84_03940 [Arenimonas sp.]|uniref:hypothetical protein n=1 Tax=Arenimonas sp. TaxID=1872635 RepID=UPI002D811461|nr:hypothetical protein [Arenimonas sp.]HEU0152480.1 hypothetical protein [Arenimonas sp.]